MYDKAESVPQSLLRRPPTNDNITQAQHFRLFSPSVIQIDGISDSLGKLPFLGLSLLSLEVVVLVRQPPTLTESHKLTFPFDPPAITHTDGSLSSRRDRLVSLNTAYRSS